MSCIRPPIFVSFIIIIIIIISIIYFISKNESFHLYSWRSSSSIDLSDRHVWVSTSCRCLPYRTKNQWGIGFASVYIRLGFAHATAIVKSLFCCCFAGWLAGSLCYFFVSGALVFPYNKATLDLRLFFLPLRIDLLPIPRTTWMTRSG